MCTIWWYIMSTWTVLLLFGNPLRSTMHKYFNNIQNLTCLTLRSLWVVVSFTVHHSEASTANTMWVEVEFCHDWYCLCLQCPKGFPDAEPPCSECRSSGRGTTPPLWRPHPRGQADLQRGCGRYAQHPVWVPPGVCVCVCVRWSSLLDLM